MAESLKIITVHGLEYDLTGLVDFTALRGMTGHTAPPYELVDDAIPGQAGTRLQHLVTGARILDIPLLITQDTRQALIDLERELSRELAPLEVLFVEVVPSAN